MTPKTYISNLDHIHQAAPDYAMKHMLIKAGVMLGVALVATSVSGYVYDRKVTFPGYEKIFWEQS